MQTIKIEIPKGRKIETFNDSKGDVTFKVSHDDAAKAKLPAMERIKTVDDILFDNNLSIDDFEESCHGLDPDERAYKVLKMLTKSLNEGWTPNWSDSNESKYYPYFEMGGSSGFRFNDFGFWHSASYVGSRLCFKTRALAEYAGKQFTDVYKKFMVIE